jgi:hypothetical protein
MHPQAPAWVQPTGILAVNVSSLVTRCSRIRHCRTSGRRSTVVMLCGARLYTHQHRLQSAVTFPDSFVVHIFLFLTGGGIIAAFIVIDRRVPAQAGLLLQVADADPEAEDGERQDGRDDGQGDEGREEGMGSAVHASPFPGAVRPWRKWPRQGNGAIRPCPGLAMRRVLRDRRRRMARRAPSGDWPVTMASVRAGAGPGAAFRAKSILAWRALSFFMTITF